MIAGAINAGLYADWLAYIKAKDAKDAFLYFVGQAACLTGYVCHPEPKGVVRAFRFMSATNDSEQPFAFIPNQEWLLFYFRQPAVRSGLYSYSALQKNFESANENGTGEWTVKLHNISEVQRLLRVLSLS